MALQDLRGLLDQDLELPIGGTVYRVPPPLAQLGLSLQLIRDAASMQAAGVELSETDQRLLKVDDSHGSSFYEWALGSAYEQMLKGGVTLAEIKVAAAAAFIYWTAATGHEQEDLETFWAAQADPRNASTGKQTTTPAVRGSAPTAEASSTRRPSSGSSTSSRKGSKKQKERPALRSAS